MAWPPPKIPPGALVASAMSPPHDPRLTGDWAAARPQDMARRAEAEARREKEHRRAGMFTRRVCGDNLVHASVYVRTSVTPQITSLKQTV
jgi:hypothetical protein